MRRLSLITTAYAVTMLVCVGAGAATAAPAAQADTGWTAPVAIDQLQGHPDTLSCPSAAYCLAVDDAGNAMSWDGSSWSTPSSLIPAADRAEGFPALVKASCGSDTFCVAVVDSGVEPGTSDRPAYAEVYSDGVWQDWTLISQQAVTAVSCATSTMCVAVTRDGSALTFDGTTWGAPVPVDPGTTLRDVACPSATFCMAVGGASDQGFAFEYDGQSWQAAPGSDQGGGMSHVSCPSATFCAAVHSDTVALFTDGTWGAPAKIGSGRNYYMIDVACVDASLCLATTQDDYLRYDGSSWTAPAPFGKRIVTESDLACPAATECVSVGSAANRPHSTIPYGTGYAVTYDGSGWGTPVIMDPAHDGPDAVSCPSLSFCAATDTAGYVLYLRHGDWSAPAKIDHAGRLTGIDCVSSSFCLATDDNGQILEYDGSAWSGPHRIDFRNALGRPSCGSPTLCVVADSNGFISMFDGSSWSVPERVARDYYVNDVSCIGDDWCEVTGASVRDQDTVSTWDGTAWSTPQRIGTVFPRDGLLSCGSPQFCAAMEIGPDAYTSYRYDGTAWGALKGYRIAAQPAGLSCSTVCAVVAAGKVQTWDGATSRWAKPVKADPRGSLSAVSCVASGRCVAVSAGGWVTES